MIRTNFVKLCILLKVLLPWLKAAAPVIPLDLVVGVMLIQFLAINFWSPPPTFC
jgi:hypothetical protein